MHADSVCLLKSYWLRIGAVGHVVDPEAAVAVRILLLRFDRGNVGRGYAQLRGELGVSRVAAERSAKLCAQSRQLVGLAADRGHVALAVHDHDVAEIGRA